MPIPPRVRKPLAAACLALLLGACAHETPHEPALHAAFTDDLLDPATGVSIPREQLDYFLSTDLDLIRQDAAAARVIRHSHGPQPPLERVHFSANTPARLVGSGEGWLALRFESGDPWLYFVAARADAPERLPGHSPDRYYLFAQPGADGYAVVRYGDREFHVVGSGLDVYLRVDSDALRPAPTAPGPAADTLPDRWLGERRH